MQALHRVDASRKRFFEFLEGHFRERKQFGAVELPLFDLGDRFIEQEESRSVVLGEVCVKAINEGEDLNTLALGHLEVIEKLRFLSRLGLSDDFFRRPWLGLAARTERNAQCKEDEKPFHI